MTHFLRKLFGTTPRPIRVNQLLEKATAAAGRHRHDIALDAVDKAIALAVEEYGADHFLVNVFLQNARAENLYWLKRYSEARIAADRSLARCPDDITMLQLRAQILVNLKDSDGVVADYTRLGTLEPDNPKHLLMLAAAHMMQNNARAARSALEAAGNHPKATASTREEITHLENMLRDSGGD